MDPRKYNSEINRLDGQRARQISKIPISIKKNERKISLIIRIELFRDLYIDIFLNKMKLVLASEVKTLGLKWKVTCGIPRQNSQKQVF